MTDLIEQAIMQHSVQDVIQILENQPVQPDLIGQITAVQVMNRVSIAHLSVERALKFLITGAGGPLTQEHHLGDRLRELAEHDPSSANFLKHAFQVAVRHYRFNPNMDNMGHLKSLESYLDVAGSDRAFQDLRYWELRQSLDEVLLRRLYLPMHLELLRAVLELLRGRSPIDTVAIRVERAVKQAMFSPSELAYAPGTPKEDSVNAYLEWIQGFVSWSDALVEAARRQFMIGDEFANGMVIKAQQALLQSVDPAVSYFADALDVLPKQPRNVIPPVEGLDSHSQQRGFVKAPSGTTLGFIERRRDGLWSITPYLYGPMAETAKAESQTDARCYLAAQFSRVAEITVNGEQRRHRIVVNEETHVQWIPVQVGYTDNLPTANGTRFQKVEFWDADHGLKGDDQISIKVRLAADRRLVHVLAGVVTKIDRNVVHLSGDYSDEFNEPDPDEQSV